MVLNNALGKKIGMTQLFNEAGDAIPVTVVNVGNWYVTQIKTAVKDGYDALQVALPRKRYRNQEFSTSWLHAKKEYFLHVKEIPMTGENAAFELGQKITLQDTSLEQGDTVAIIGISKGLGFQGVVKRWGFSGGPGGHGSKFHRIPGAIGHLRRQGEVIKGKKLPGHMGMKRTTVKGLKIAHIDKENGYVFVQGAVPGKKDTLITIKK
ncbi:MAG: 50S ribosomal protein L3 [Epsilonproteobacteria bacterium]|nr:50S ribosomal protein L3 [Campylobacterota bacterium]